jgi:hypothetical protein
MTEFQPAEPRSARTQSEESTVRGLPARSARPRKSVTGTGTGRQGGLVSCFVRVWSVMPRR